MANAAIDGDWKTSLSTPMGPQESTIHFETDGDIVRGRLSAAEGSVEFTGSVSGTNLQFGVEVEKPMKLKLSYDVQIDGDSLTGKVKLGMFGSGKLTGERV